MFPLFVGVGVVGTGPNLFHKLYDDDFALEIHFLVFQNELNEVF